MPQYDGSIRINTKIDTKNVSSQMLRLENQIAKASKKASDLTQKMREIESQKIPTEDYKDISDALHRSNQQFDKLLQKQQSMISSGKTSGKVWDDLDRKIEEVGADIRASEKYISRMKTDGTAYLSKDAIRATESYKKLENQLRDTNNQINLLSKRHGELSVKEKLVENGATRAKKSTGGWLDSFSRKTRKSSGILSGFASRLKGMALSLFVFNWITKGWNEMISAIKDGTQNVAKYSSDVNSKMSAMTSALSTLKNAFGSLAAPIISAFGPAITSFINMLTAAINKVNQFISAITGKKTWIKATTQVKDYAGGLSSAASGADKAAKSVKKLKGQLQSFNELNVINSNDSGSGSGGSGGSGGGGGVSDMFEEVPIDSGIKNLADEIRNAIEAGNWEGLGETIRSKITETIGKIPWNSLYSNAKDFGKNFASFLNGLFSSDKKGNNVFTATADVIAGALNTAIFASKGFTDKFDFKTFGKNVAHGFNRFFKKFEWKQCAKAINGWVDGFWKFVVGFFDELSFEDIFNGLKDFITNLDSKTIATIIGIAAIKKFGKNIGIAIKDNIGSIAITAGLVVGIVSATFSLSKDLTKWFFDWYNEKYGTDYDTGKIDDMSFLDIVLSGVKLSFDENGNIQLLGLENLQELFPESELVDFFDGLLNGAFLKGFQNLSTEDFKNATTKGFTGLKIEDLCIEIGVKIKTKASELWTKFKKDWGNSRTAKFLLGISSKAKDLWSGFKKGWNNVKDKVADFKARVKSKAKDLWDKFHTSWNNVKDKVADFKARVKSKASDLWNNFKTDWGESRTAHFLLSIKSKVSELWGNFKKSWGETKTAKFLLKIGSKISELWDNFKKSWGDSKKVSIGIGFVKGALSGLWDSVKNFFGGKSISVGASATKKADGGVYSGGIWHDITHYAVGTSNAPTGQVFVAREAGPELVGTLGGHTAVMNNDQIVASVSDGVYRAVKSAMGSGKQNLNVTFKVEGDPNGIFRVTQQKANEYFRATGNPAFEF